MTTAREPSVLVIQNGPDGGPGRVGQWLTEEGLRLDIGHGYQTQLPNRLEHDAIIVLGGGFLPDADEKAPWLATTRTLTRQALDESKPFLGICLGGQLLAHVAGGTVEGDVGAPENGSTPITLRPEAHDDVLLGGLPEIVPAIEHHVDAITALPKDAVWLAQTDRCPYQAFRIGELAWGTQFHPEIDPQRVRNWGAERLREHGFDPETVYTQAEIDDEVSRPLWEKVTRRFAAVVKGTASN